jgi:hypothetical protein
VHVSKEVEESTTNARQLQERPPFLGCGSNDIDPSWAGFEVGIGLVALRLMTRIDNPISLEYLPVYTPSAAEKADADLFAANVRLVMGKALGCEKGIVKLTEHNLEDLMLQE